MLSRRAILAALLLLFGTVHADETSGVKSAEARWGKSVDELLELHLTETERVRMVLLEASVTDRKGRVVRGLQEKDFKVFEDQVPQEITYFSAEDAEPLAAAFLLDVSGSMGNMAKLQRAKDSIRILADRLRPEDRLALIRFADEGVSWVTDFTHDRSTLYRSLEAEQPYGQTAMIDALVAAPDLVQDKIKTRKAIVLITDADDNSSKTPVQMAVELARRVNVPIYTIAFLSVSRNWLPKGTLEKRFETIDAISAATGGRVFPVYSKDELQAALQALEAELSSQYLIGYYPVGQPDGEFHEISVKLGKSRFRARTRSGYYATR